MNKPASKASALVGLIAGIGALLLVAVVFSQSLLGLVPLQSGYPGPGTKIAPTTAPTLDRGKETQNAIERATLAAVSTAPVIDKRTPPPSPEKLDPPVYLQRPAGDGHIVEGMPALDLQSSFLSSNAWIQTKKDRYTLVWAGVQRDRTEGKNEQGAVIVEVRSLPDHQPLAGGGLYVTPTKSGPVIIADATGQILTLRALDGSTFSFNVVSGRYVGPDQTALERRVGQATIAESDAAPFTLAGVRFWNQWTAVRGNDRVAVFAGIEGGDWRRGTGTGKSMIALVVSKAASSSTAKPQILYPPQAVGAMRVFDAQDDKVILVDSGGQAFVFDTVAQRFLEKSEFQLSLAPLFELGTITQP